MSRWRAAVPLLALGAAACVDLTGSAVPNVRAVHVEAPSSLVRVLDVTLAASAPMHVEYWTAGEARFDVDVPAAGTNPAVPLTHLLPNRTYRYAVANTPVTDTFATGQLPADLESIGFQATGTLTIPLVLVHLSQPQGFQGYAAVDGAGRVVWYWRTDGFPFGATRRANGDFVFLDGARGLVEVTPAGQVVHELSQDSSRGLMHHDVVASPQNTLLVIAYDTRTVNGAPLKGDAIWEWSPEGATFVKRWTAWDFFSPDTDRGPRFTTEWMHANALHIGLRGNILLSIHFFDQVVSITPDWHTIAWRLGGVNATIPVPDSEKFSGQHAVSEVAPNHILMFDNGIERGGYSRAVEFDISGDTARAMWQFRPDPPNFASAVGSARRLPDGNTLVAFGLAAGVAGSTGPTEIYEVSPGGAVLWHLAVNNVTVMFRGEPLGAIGAEHVVSLGPGQ